MVVLLLYLYSCDSLSYCHVSYRSSSSACLATRSETANAKTTVRKEERHFHCERIFCERRSFKDREQLLRHIQHIQVIGLENEAIHAHSVWNQGQLPILASQGES